MRGTLLLFSYAFDGARFIPAHAGNTGSLMLRYKYKPVHPRTCGEHGGEGIRVLGCPGSSPHMRGTQYAQKVIALSTRFIPAHAGNTTLQVFSFLMSSVHPRTCGEHPNRSAHRALRAGSSPHMRGTHLTGPIVHCLIRFIPAHAGNTL